MRPKALDHTIIYVRFRKDLDKVITDIAEKQNVPKATLVSRAITEILYSNSRGDPLLSSHSSRYFSKIGRSLESNIGKPMRITLNKIDDNKMKLLAQRYGYTATELRTAIMVTWLEQMREM